MSLAGRPAWVLVPFHIPIPTIQCRLPRWHAPQQAPAQLSEGSACSVRPVPIAPSVSSLHDIRAAVYLRHYRPPSQKSKLPMDKTVPDSRKEPGKKTTRPFKKGGHKKTEAPQGLAVSKSILTDTGAVLGRHVKCSQNLLICPKLLLRGAFSYWYCRRRQLHQRSLVHGLGLARHGCLFHIFEMTAQ